jgi:parvulin-like peptidyl-prolyl isomerase
MRFLVLALVLAGAAFSTRGQSGGVVNGIAVIVNEKVITLKDVNGMIREEADFLQRRYASDPKTFEEKLKALQAERIEELVEHQLVLHEFESLARPLPESYIDNRLNEDIKKFGDRLTLTKTLQAEGLTFESYKQKVKERTILELMYSIKVPRDPVISPTRIENFYLTNQTKFQLEDRVKLRMIVLTNRTGSVVAPKDLAADIAKKIDDGASFAEMAKVYSQGNAAADGGDMGWVEKKMLRDDLATVAFATKPGTRSDVIESPAGIYLMYVEQAQPAHTRGLSEVREEIEATLKAEEGKRLKKLFIDRLKKKSFVRYF